MSLEERFNEVLAELAGKLGLDPAHLLMRDGYACLVADRAKIVHMHLPENANFVVVFMELGEVSQAARQAVCEDMLQGNVLLQGTRGAALGLDGQRGIATLSMRLAVAGMELATLQAGLEDFLAAGDFWEERIASPGASSGGEGGGDLPDAGGFMRV